MIRKPRKRLAAIAAAVLMVLGVNFIAAPSASAASGTISGTVRCYWDNDAEVGVWVNTASGTDGWASWWSNGDGSISYSYTLSQSSSYELRIGCGGTPSSWNKSFVTYNDVSGGTFVSGQYYDWVCTFQGGLGYVCMDS